mmetsp:Transcript_3914/g.12539  ORF Transcript_3914/g.12539 Transcript_3914/m.12539 type:complete len:90 (-) Transcript_3914:248-517(-)
MTAQPPLGDLSATSRLPSSLTRLCPSALQERDAQLRAAAIDVDNEAQSCSAGGAAEPHHPPPVGQVRRLPSGVSFGDDEDGLLALGQES